MSKRAVNLLRKNISPKMTIAGGNRRYNLEVLTTTATSIQPNQGGTIFMLDGTSYSAAVTHSLPHPSEAGAGWWCKFIVKTAVLDAGDDNCLIKIRNSGAATFIDDLLLIQVHETAGAAGLQDVDADFITVKGAAKGGTMLHFMTNGTKFYCVGSSKDVSADMAVDT